MSVASAASAQSSSLASSSITLASSLLAATTPTVIQNVGTLNVSNTTNTAVAGAAAKFAASEAAALPKMIGHYMCFGDPVTGSYASDISDAKTAGIQAFALNFGGWGNNFDLWEKCLDGMYAAAAADGQFKVFMSFDMTSVSDPAMITRISIKFAKSPAQVYIGNRMLISTFQTSEKVSFDWKTNVLSVIESSVGAAPFFIPGSIGTDASALFSQAYADGVFTWIHPSSTAADENKNDAAFAAARDSSKKIWIVGVGVWFFKHYSEDLNWGNTQDDAIFIDRWQSLLKLKPDAVELLTFNDFGESSYLAAPDLKNATGAGWASFDHTPFRSINLLFASSFIRGSSTLQISAADEGVYAFYRRQPWATRGTSDTLGPPKDASCKDSIFVVSFLTSAAEIVLSNGGTDTKIVGEIGLKKTATSFQTGSVSLTMSRGGSQIVKKTGPDIMTSFAQYNGNAVCI